MVSLYFYLHLHAVNRYVGNNSDNFLNSYFCKPEVKLHTISVCNRTNHQNINTLLFPWELDTQNLFIDAKIQYTYIYISVIISNLTRAMICLGNIFQLTILLVVFWCRSIAAYYNMVGVAVAMVISTMHEKSCIDSHNAQKFEKSFKKSSHSHIP